MSYQITNVDRAGFAEALLSLAKSHMRVEFARDDEYIKNCIIRAADMMERFSGARIVKAAADWFPAIVTSAYVHQVPLQPVASFTAMAGGVDVSADFRIRSRTAVDPVFLEHIDRTAFPPGIEVALVLGYASATEIPPMYLDPILRMAAHLYEHRESVDQTNLMAIPQWANDLLCGTWIPRC